MIQTGAITLSQKTIPIFRRILNGGKSGGTNFGPSDISRLWSSYDAIGTSPKAIAAKRKLAEELWDVSAPSATRILIEAERNIDVPSPDPVRFAQVSPVYLFAAGVGNDFGMQTMVHENKITRNPEYYHAGGAPTNFLIVATRLGLNCSPLYVVGDGIRAEHHVRLLKTNGVNLPEHNQFKIDGEDTAFHFMLPPANFQFGGEQIVFSDQRIIQPSPSFAKGQFEDYTNRFLDMANSNGIAVVSSRPPSNSPSWFLANLLTQLKQRNNFVIVDPKPDQLSNENYAISMFFAGMDLYTPDIDEFILSLKAAQIRGLDTNEQDLRDKKEPKLINEYAQKLMHKFPGIKAIIISTGKNGGILAIKGKGAFSVPAPAAKRLNPIGCGDTGLAFLVDGLARIPREDLFNPKYRTGILKNSLVGYVRGGSAAVRVHEFPKSRREILTRKKVSVSTV